VSDDPSLNAEEWRHWLLEGAHYSTRPVYYKSIENSSVFRNTAFSRTQNGYMSLVPSFTNEQDVVCIISGHTMPLVLRPIGEYFQIIGQCYIHGMMES